MHYLNRKKGKKGFIAIKRDLAKAHDKVEWKVLNQMLKQFDFSDQVVNLIAQCTDSTIFSILINNSPFGYFKADRGIRQGAPISPAPFTLFSDLLLRILSKVVEDGKFNWIKVSRESLKITTYVC